MTLHTHLEEARCLFISGPVAVYVCEAPGSEILEEFDRVRRLVEIAARKFDEKRIVDRVTITLPKEP